MSNHSIIEHRANYHFIKIEEDYVLICSNGAQYPQCKAAILAILEHWINDKKAKGQGEYVYMTYPEWINAMYGLFRRNTIIACLSELVQENLVIRRPCRRYGKDTFEYTMNIPVVQEKLKNLPERTDKNTRPNLNASKFKRVQKQTGLNLNDESENAVQIQTGNPSKSKRNIDTTTQNQEDIDSEWYVAPAQPDRESDDSATATADRDAHAPKIIEMSPAQYLYEQTTEVLETVEQQRDALSQDSYSHATPTATLSQDVAAKSDGYTNPEKKPARGGRKKAATPEQPVFTAEGQQVYGAWCSLFKSPPPAGPQTIKCANALYPLLVPWCHDLRRTCAQLLDDIQKQMYATDKNKFYARGITLCDVHRDFEKWQSAMTQGAISSKPKSEDDPYSLEALFARQGQALT